MRRLFNLDLPVVQTVGKFGTMMLMNVWWLICCVPIVTIGASTAAMHRMMFNLREEKSTSTGDFFRAFRDSFKNATLLWLLALAGAVVIAAVYYGIALLEIPDAVRLVMVMLCLVLLILWLFPLLYVFPLTAFFENSVKGTVKNAFLMSVSHLRCTIICAGLTMLPLAACLISAYWFFNLGFVWAVVIPGLLFYVKSGQLLEVFSEYAPAGGPNGETEE